ncbi:hypothetical protein [Okeania sp. SIO1I7]|uniref:hypothetical protein n=1 Tax=Okeania sp. SIO1I7 TaxID=2607772 RepID=UPI0013FB0CE1|nr:hypothetical protein [Okeania sp. SIO1I7]NET25925.1 hypothetical protein [Okeania sp. SIO1I7]
MRRSRRCQKRIKLDIYFNFIVIAEGRRKKEEGRRKKEEGKILPCLNFKLLISP